MNIFPYGDSKTQGITADDPAYAALGYGYVWKMLELIGQNTGQTAYELPARVGRGGTSIQGFKNTVDSDLATRPQTPDYILVNIGTGDKSLTINAATSSNYGSVLDALHTKWPAAQVLCALPWQPTVQASLAQFELIGNAIMTAVASRSWARIGIDEKVVLGVGNDGATYTSVGHPTHDGYMRTAKAWLVAMFGQSGLTPASGMGGVACPHCMGLSRYPAGRGART